MLADPPPFETFELENKGGSAKLSSQKGGLRQIFGQSDVRVSKF